MLEAKNITFSYPHKTILNDFSISLAQDDFTMLLGANGSGKSTAIRLLSGFLTPQKGTVVLDDVPLKSMKHLDRTRKIAVVPQTAPPVLDFTVFEMVMMGRLCRTPGFLSPDDRDKKWVHDIMETMGIGMFSSRPVSRLSGGEQQRVMLAQALAGQPDYLLLDEPTSALDPEHVFLLMNTLKSLCSRTGIFMVCHDLNLAWNYAKKVIILKDSRIHLQGSTRETLTPENIADVFKCQAFINKEEGIILKDAKSSGA